MEIILEKRSIKLKKMKMKIFNLLSCCLNQSFLIIFIFFCLKNFVIKPYFCIFHDFSHKNVLHTLKLSLLSFWKKKKKKSKLNFPDQKGQKFLRSNFVSCNHFHLECLSRRWLANDTRYIRFLKVLVVI